MSGKQVVSVSFHELHRIGKLTITFIGKAVGLIRDNDAQHLAAAFLIFLQLDRAILIDPGHELTIVEGPADAVIETINREVLISAGERKKTGVIASDENVPYYSADVVKCIGNRNNPEEVAASLYRILREMDDENVEAIFSESFSEEGLGEAIMNRLLKAAGHRKITV